MICSGGFEGVESGEGEGDVGRREGRWNVMREKKVREM